MKLPFPGPLVGSGPERGDGTQNCVKCERYTDGHHFVATHQKGFTCAISDSPSPVS